jgi:hypothetical protein
MYSVERRRGTHIRRGGMHAAGLWLTYNLTIIKLYFLYTIDSTKFRKARSKFTKFSIRSAHHLLSVTTKFSSMIIALPLEVL